MEFKKYQHLERFGNTEVEGIELGKVYVFPKIDGTNSSVWLDENGIVQAGSRNRQLTLDNDNAGFLAWVREQSGIAEYLYKNTERRLYGEWLVPHSFKQYTDSAWRKFYIFDVEENNELLPYEEYMHGLDGLDYITPICIIQNGSYEQFIKAMENNLFLVKDGKGTGEGIVLKNYQFKNKFGRNIFAKIVSSEFKEMHKKKFGVSEIDGKRMVEEEIAKEFVTTALVEKVKAKIENECGFSNKQMLNLLNTVYYDVVHEDCWTFIKKYKNPTINFKTLQHFVFKEVKSKL